jgi:hypothetical protein
MAGVIPDACIDIYFAEKTISAMPFSKLDSGDMTTKVWL